MGVIMSEELKALKRIGKLEVNGLRAKPTKTIVSDYNDYLIIETALKRLEQLQIIIGAEKIEDLPKVALETENACYSNSYNLKKAKKKLKALEIIKEHPEQIMDIIETDNYNEYLDLDYAPVQYLSEENYYLVKEILL